MWVSVCVCMCVCVCVCVGGGGGVFVCARVWLYIYIYIYLYIYICRFPKCGYLETYVGISRHNVGISRLSIEYLYILPNDLGTMSGEFRVQNYRLKKKIAEASLAVCILDQLSKYNLTVNADKSEKYEIPRPPAPTPPPTKMEVLI